jgi:hypothetical protein
MVTMSTMAFWVVIPRGVVGIYYSFEEKYSFLHQENFVTRVATHKPPNTFA